MLSDNNNNGIKNGLFQRKDYVISSEGHVAFASYTDGRGIDFSLRRQNPTTYELVLSVTKPFVLVDKTDIPMGEYDDFNDVLHSTSVYVYGLFSGIQVCLDITAEAMMKQFD